MDSVSANSFDFDRDNAYLLGYKSIKIWMLIIIIGATLGNIIAIIFGLYGIIAQIIFQLIGIYIVSQAIKQEPDNFEFDDEEIVVDQTKQNILFSLNLWLIYIGLFYIIGRIIDFFVSLIEDETISAYSNLARGIWGSFFLFVSLVILAPIFEELIFRKYIMQLFLKSGYSQNLTLFFSTFIFSITHSYSDLRLGTVGFAIQHLFISMGAGFLFGIIYLYTKSIKYPIFIHLVTNFYGVIPLLWAEFYPFTSEDYNQYFIDSDVLSDQAFGNIAITLRFFYTLRIFSLLCVGYFIIQLFRNYRNWLELIGEFASELKSKIFKNKVHRKLLLILTLGLLVFQYTFYLGGQLITEPDYGIIVLLSESAGYAVAYIFAIIGIRRIEDLKN